MGDVIGPKVGIRRRFLQSLSSVLPLKHYNITQIAFRGLSKRSFPWFCNRRRVFRDDRPEEQSLL